MRKLIVLMLLASVAYGAKKSAPDLHKSHLRQGGKFVETGYTMQDDEVCITLDKKRDAGVCMTPNEIQKCMDNFGGTCYAQLVRSGNIDEGTAKALISICDPTKTSRKPQAGICDEREWKQYQFRYGSSGAFQAVLY